MSLMCLFKVSKHFTLLMLSVVLKIIIKSLANYLKLIEVKIQIM